MCLLSPLVTHLHLQGSQSIRIIFNGTFLNYALRENIAFIFKMSSEELNSIFWILANLLPSTFTHISRISKGKIPNTIKYVTLNEKFRESYKSEQSLNQSKTLHKVNCTSLFPPNASGWQTNQQLLKSLRPQASNSSHKEQT